MYTRYFIIVLLVTIFGSCSSSYSSFDEQLEDKVEKLNIDGSVYCITLPNQGCYGCLRQVWDFIESHNDPRLIIVTSSKEELRRLEKNKRNKVLYMKDANLGMFPFLYYITDHRIRNSYELDSYCIAQELYVLENLLKDKHYKANIGDVYRYAQISNKPRLLEKHGIRDCLAHLHFTQEIIEDHQILVSMTIGVKGKITNVEILHPFNGQDYSELVDQVYQFGPWEPGNNGGIKYPTTMIFSIALQSNIKNKNLKSTL